MRQSVIRTLERLAPSTMTRIRVTRMMRRPSEFEMHLLPVLCRPSELSIDVGSSLGAYSFRMARHSRWCYAFDPQVDQAERLSQACRQFGLPVTVLAVGLSDREGRAELRVLPDASGRSTIESGNALADEGSARMRTIEVPIRTLDSFDLAPVGFIKVDVEGHEDSVLAGAGATIARSRPNLLIESEERHNRGVIERVRQYFAQRDYAGLFVSQGKLIDLSAFDPARHQRPEELRVIAPGVHKTGRYINNFIFVPCEREGEFRAAARALIEDRYAGFPH